MSEASANPSGAPEGFGEIAKAIYPAPSQLTFCRMFQGVDGLKVEQTLLAIQEQVRGQPPQDESIALDGKEPKPGGGQGVLSAISVPRQHLLGSVIVETKTNEIPMAPELFKRLECLLVDSVGLIRAINCG